MGAAAFESLRMRGHDNPSQPPLCKGRSFAPLPSPPHKGEGTRSSPLPLREGIKGRGAFLL